MSKIFVIAGTREEAVDWIQKDCNKKWNSGTNTSVSLSDYVYIDSHRRILGIKNPHGVFVGNWLGRPDILEIVESLMIASTQVNPALGKIYKDLRSKARQNPKLHKVAGGWSIGVQDAANLLAKEIDAEVMRNVHAKINGGQL